MPARAHGRRLARLADELRAAFDAAEEQFGVPQLLDADDPECWDDEQSMITYLGEMMAHVPDRVVPYVDPDEAAKAADGGDSDCSP